MIRSFCLIALASLATTLMGAGCADKKGDGQRGRTMCHEVHQRNRKCVNALVSTIHRRMGKNVPADLKKNLAKKLGAEITKSAFVAECRERTEANHDLARATKKALRRCLAASDCPAYAACFMKTMGKTRAPR